MNEFVVCLPDENLEHYMSRLDKPFAYESLTYEDFRKWACREEEIRIHTSQPGSTFIMLLCLVARDITMRTTIPRDPNYVGPGTRYCVKSWGADKIWFDVPGTIPGYVGANGTRVSIPLHKEILTVCCPFDIFSIILDDHDPPESVVVYLQYILEDKRSNIIEASRNEFVYGGLVYNNGIVVCNC